MRLYDKQRSGLGAEFLDEVDATVVRVCVAPEAYGQYDSRVRIKLVHRFPYAVYYRIDPDEMVILAVAHTSRLPRYW